MPRPPSRLGQRLTAGPNNWSVVVDRLHSESHAPVQVVGRDTSGAGTLYRLRLRDAGGAVFWQRNAILPDAVVLVDCPAEGILETQAEGPECSVWAICRSTQWDGPWPVEVT